jgi:hypothetical protein
MFRKAYLIAGFVFSLAVSVLATDEKVCPFGICLGEPLPAGVIADFEYDNPDLGAEVRKPPIQNPYFNYYGVVRVPSTGLVATVVAKRTFLPISRITCKSELEQVAIVLNEKYAQGTKSDQLFPSITWVMPDLTTKIFLFCEPVRQVSRTEFDYFPVLQYSAEALTMMAARERKQAKTQELKKGL